MSDLTDTFLRMAAYIKSAREAIDPVPQTGSIGGDMLAAAPAAMLGMRPHGVSYTSTPRPTLRSQGKYVSQKGPFPPHPATDIAPALGAADVMANVYPHLEERQSPAGKDVAGTEGQPGGDSFASRYGAMTPPAEPPAQTPLFLQSGAENVPAQYAERWEIKPPKQQIASNRTR